MKNDWSEISLKLLEKLDSSYYDIWIAPLKGQVIGHKVLLSAPSPFVAQWVDSRLSQDIAEVSAAVIGCKLSEVKVEISCTTNNEAQNSQFVESAKFNNKEESQINRQKTIKSKINKANSKTDLDSLIASEIEQDNKLGKGEQANLPLPVKSLASKNVWKYNFADLVIGESNRFAVVAAQDICRQASPLTTLFVSASAGLGKTHLSQSVGAAICQEYRSAHIAYLTAENFASRFIAALKNKEIEEFKIKLRQLDFLLLEDVHFLRGKEKIQDMVLGIVKHLQDAGGRVLFTSTLSPKEMQQLDPQLVSHFCSGVIANIEAPNEDMRKEIVSRKAKYWQVKVPEPICDLLASRLQGDIRQLESCLQSLVYKAKLLNCGITTELALDALSQYATMNLSPSFETIIRLVCESFGLDMQQLTSSSRKQEFVTARNTIYWLARKHTELSLSDIGAKFKRRHTTVIKGITSVERELEAQTKLGRQISRTLELIERNATYTH